MAVFPPLRALPFNATTFVGVPINESPLAAHPAVAADGRSSKPSIVLLWRHRLPERGTMTFLTIVETMAGHDLNHLGQLQRLADAA
jgi:hypothetical protein